MKVWVLLECQVDVDSGCVIAGVFSSPEHADEKCAELNAKRRYWNHNSYNVEEYDVYDVIDPVDIP